MQDRVHLVWKSRLSLWVTIDLDKYLSVWFRSDYRIRLIRTNHYMKNILSKAGCFSFVMFLFIKHYCLESTNIFLLKIFSTRPVGLRKDPQRIFFYFIRKFYFLFLKNFLQNIFKIIKIKSYPHFYCKKYCSIYLYVR